MFEINSNFLDLNKNYLFTEIFNIVADFKINNPQKKLIDMSIGDVKLPLDKSVINEMIKACQEMGDLLNFKGYAPEQGYLFLREEIKEKYRSKFNVSIDVDEIFVNDGSKSDLGNILEIFSDNNIIGINSVSYPVYYDLSKINGLKTSIIKSCEDNDFLPMPYDIQGLKPDLIYFCSPNNPTGMVYNYYQLEKWINFCLEHKIIVLFDAAYQDYISDDSLPKSIYQIKDAKKCAIEFFSFSKSAGFTGVRCGYMVFPKDIKTNIKEKIISLNKLWARHQATKFNGVSYISQRAATAFLKYGTQRYINHCRKNVLKIISCLEAKKLKYWGGIHSPYLWVRTPKGYDSNMYFRYLINNFGIISTPGIGFGSDGANFIRLSSFFIDN